MSAHTGGTCESGSVTADPTRLLLIELDCLRHALPRERVRVATLERANETIEEERKEQKARANAAESSALERAVEIARIERDAQASLNAKSQPSWFHRGALVAFDNVLGKLRALIPPAAAPAAQEDTDNAQAKSTDQGAARVVGVGGHDRSQGEAVAEVEAAKVAAAPASEPGPDLRAALQDATAKMLPLLRCLHAAKAIVTDDEAGEKIRRLRVLFAEYDATLATPVPAQGAEAPDLRAMLAHGIADADGYVQMERLQGDTQMAAFHAGRRAAYQQLEAVLDNLAARAASPKPPAP